MADYMFRVFKDEDNGKRVRISESESYALAGVYEVIGLINKENVPDPSVCDLEFNLNDVIHTKEIGENDTVRFIVNNTDLPTMKLMGELIEKKYIYGYSFRVGYPDDVQCFR